LPTRSNQGLAFFQPMLACRGGGRFSDVNCRWIGTKVILAGFHRSSINAFVGYAKAIDLSAESEPDIFGALHFGTLLENVVFDDEHTSAFYFCKMFKKATGLTFTKYLGRLRIEKVKQLLSNLHLRIKRC